MSTVQERVMINPKDTTMLLIGADAVVVVYYRVQPAAVYVSGPWWGRNVDAVTGRKLVGVTIKYGRYRGRLSRRAMIDLKMEDAISAPGNERSPCPRSPIRSRTRPPAPRTRHPVSNYPERRRLCTAARR